MALSGYRLASGTLTIAEIDANSTYAIENFTRQSDMTPAQLWRRPGNVSDVIKPEAEIVTALDGSRGGQGGAEFTWAWEFMTYGQIDYMNDTFFNSSADWSAAVTVRTYNRANGTWEYYTATAIRPTVDEMEIVGKSFSYPLSFIECTLLTDEDEDMAYGEIYAENTSSVTLSTTPSKLAVFDTNGESSSDVTPDHANDQISVTTAGTYRCHFGFAIVLGASDDSDYKFNFRINGVEVTPGAEFALMYDGNYPNDLMISRTRMLALAASDVVTVYGEANDATGKTVDLKNAVLNIEQCRD